MRGFLIGLLEKQRDLPVSTRPDFRTLEPLLVGDGAGHHLTGLRGVDENLLLPFGRGERLALLDAQRLEHPHHHPVALVDRFLLDDLREALPVGEAAWLFAAPWATRRRDVTGWGWVFALAVGIDLQSVDERLGFGRIGIEHAVGGPDVHRGRTEDSVALRLHVRVIGAEDQILSTRALIGAGLAGIGDGPLPEIGEAARRRAGGHLEHQRPGLLQIGKRHDVGRRGIGREEAELVLKGEVVDVVELAGAELGEVLALPLLHRHQRQGPEVGLAGPLKVDVVEDFRDGGIGGVAVLQFQRAEPRCDASGGGEELPVGRWERQAADDCGGENDSSASGQHGCFLAELSGNY